MKKIRSVKCNEKETEKAVEKDRKKLLTEAEWAEDRAGAAEGRVAKLKTNRWEWST